MYQYESKKSTASTKMASLDMGKKSAPSRRRVFNSSANQHYRQVSENIIQRAPIITVGASQIKTQYSAGAARLPLAELLSRIPDDQEFIKRMLLTEDWRALIECENIRFRAKKILKDWNEFLPQFLEHYGFESHGGNQSHTCHRSGRNDAAEQIDRQDEMRTSKIRRLYKGSSGIRGRRKYIDDEAIKRYLRHCAAALAINFGIEDEIQCYYHDDDKAVYVATNNDADSGLSEINGMKISDCSAVLEHSLREINEYMADNDNSPIWSRFKAKLIDTLLSNRKAKPLLRRLGHALTCPAPLRDATFKVMENIYGIQGLHAERKILYYLRSQKENNNTYLDPLRLGGIRRPCFICSALCFADMSQVRPGPVWVSSAASTPRDILEMFLILDAIRNRNYITYVSESDGNLTTGNDTESEGSESECDIH